MKSESAASDPEVFDRVLARRSERLRHQQGIASDEHIVEEIAVLQVANERVGVPVDGLREVVSCPPASALPGLPRWIVGIVQIRGELMAVVDIAVWLKIESAATGRHLAVIEGPQGPVGILVDRVIGFRELHDGDMAREYATRDGVAGRLLRGMTTDLVSILDVDRLVTDTDLIVGSGA